MWFGPLEHNTLHPRENWVIFLLKPALSEPFLFFDPLEMAPARTFYSSRSGSYNEPQGPTGDPGVGEPYTVGHNGQE
jgi:hypothetical protein